MRAFSDSYLFQTGIRDYGWPDALCTFDAIGWLMFTTYHLHWKGNSWHHIDCFTVRCM